ncbi:hypothetical protein HAX54_050968 [Datura stramonium]|uniref:Uncharacterized protein n=1 Tax=Datura stramonium TaxID=4076 RepID=A0ABS8SX61_DATST|nr:hypothetical protein [Datura stramonium]
MDFKLLSFLIFHCFLINSSICASLPLPKEALPTKSSYLPPPAPPFSTRSMKPEISPHLFLKPQFLFGSKKDLDAPLCLEIGVCHLLTRQNVEHVSLKPNHESWNRIFGLLFLDNPIGVGFSIASTPEE